MNRRAVGFGFVFTAALLYAVRFLSAAIYGSSQASWNADLFRGLLQYVDQGLTTFSIIALVLGVLYLIWGELTAQKAP